MRRLPLFLLSIFIAVSAAVGIMVKNPGFETSLTSLVGEEAFALPAEIRREVSSRVQVIASSKSFDAAVATAAEFVSRLDTGVVSSVRFRVDGEGLSEMLGFYRRNGGGFMSQRDRTAASDGGLVDRVIGRLASSVPSLFGFKDDPFRFLDDFVKTRPQGFGSWRMKKGVLAAEKDGLWHVLSSFSLPQDCAFDIKKLPLVLGPVIRICQSINCSSDNAELSVSGVPVHTFEAAGRCERQIAVLSFFSVVFIVSLALWIFRSVKKVLLVAVNLMLASVAGFTAVNFAFGSIHLLSLVFGTTLMGLAVDYSFHALLTGGGRREMHGNLLKSFLTSVTGLLPLAFSGIEVLMQTAVFLVAGLAVSLVYNLTVPDMDGSGLRRISQPRFFQSRALSPVLPFFFILSIVGLFFVRFRTDADDIHSPPVWLVTAERLNADLSGLNSGSGMAVVRGDDLEDALEKEESLFPDSVCLSRFVPSYARRMKNHRLMKDFYDDRSSEIAERLGTENVFPAPVKPKKLTEADLPAALADQFVFAGANGSVMTLVPAVSRTYAEQKCTGNDAVSFCAPAAVLAEMISGYGMRARRLLMLSFALLTIVLMFFYRLRALLILLPSALGVSTMFSVVSFFCGHVNFFHLLAAFMVVGMTIDYTVFLAGDFRGGFKAVLCSLLTSLVGFGALAFVSFPLVRSLGVALAVGLPVSFLAAVALFRPRDDSRERAATPAGMEIAFFLYRIFGKKALDLVARTVATVVWIFDARARKAAGTRRRLMNFAMSLGDKIAVLSMGSGQPRIFMDDTPDASGFVADVAAGKGVVVISSHLGNIETLAAYGECAARFHVFMSLSQTGVFRAFKERHARRAVIEVHPTEGFGMAELFLGMKIVERGDVVLIAGDRGGGRSREVPFLGGRWRFPEGAFRFAAHLERPVYFVASVREDPGYRVFVKRLPVENALDVYARELERLVGMYPDQWYQWEGDGEDDG